ncbi:flagellar biosynthesis anti-sigma factor FlgM [Curvibacter sp. HBC61]|uniref:Negative regulator of flagellin synthesis n=1 Tax=Curvibacter cyanobacteriorum TaxID=3026422 RepID=A0ABT5N1E7_9BURK|nr:flagellar biosynthesis anti-sigma factor FlgM [Curvibacter sp. HBC61]MDD0840138.1 flagellar biosynthesis anti-sigma factor FlgM [Curvibacter sp. HBC61]
MKIGQTPDIPVALTTTGAQVAGQGAAAPPVKKSGNSGSGASVSVSSLAKSLGSGSSDSDMDMDKVAAVKSAIDNGTYKVNAGAIADKLLSNAQEILSRGTPQ